MPGKNHNRLAKLNFITFLKRIGLVLVYRLTINFSAICAALIPKGIIVVSQTNDRCMKPGNGQVFEKDIAFPTSPNAKRFFTYLIDTPGFFTFFNAYKTSTLGSLRSTCTA